MSSASSPTNLSHPSHPFVLVMTPQAIQTTTDSLLNNWDMYLQDTAYLDLLKTRLQTCIHAIPATIVSGLSTYACHRYMGSYRISVLTAMLTFVAPYSLFPADRSESMVIRRLAAIETTCASLQKCLQAISALFVAGIAGSVTYYRMGSYQIPALTAIFSFASFYFLAPQTYFHTLASKISQTFADAYNDATHWNSSMTLTSQVLKEAFACKALFIFDAAHEELSNVTLQPGYAKTLILSLADAYDNGTLDAAQKSAPPYAQKTKPPVDYHTTHISLLSTAQKFLEASKNNTLQGKSYTVTREMRDLAQRFLHGSSAAESPDTYVKLSPKDGGGFSPELWEADPATTGYWEAYKPKPNTATT